MELDLPIGSVKFELEDIREIEENATLATVFRVQEQRIRSRYFLKKGGSHGSKESSKKDFQEGCEKG